MLVGGHEQRRRCSGVPGTGNIGQWRRVVTGRQQHPPPPPVDRLTVPALATDQPLPACRLLTD